MNLRDLLKTKHNIIQAPMAGAQDADLAIAVCKAGGLGSLPCASISNEQIRREVSKIRSQTNLPFNLNFFCHANPSWDVQREEIWKKALEPYYLEFGLNIDMEVSPSSRNPFNEESCKLIELERRGNSHEIKIFDPGQIVETRHRSSLYHHLYS